MQITIRAEAPEDYEAVRDINLKAFDTPAEADLVDQMRVTGAWVPELSLVAIVDNRIVGHALFSEITVEQDDGTMSALALGPIAVDPDYQRRGIGGALIEAGHKRARALSYPFVVLLGHPDYYPRFGYVPAGQYRLSTIWDVPDEVFMVCELQPDALDNAAGRVRYAAPFEAL